MDPVNLGETVQRSANLGTCLGLAAIEMVDRAAVALMKPILALHLNAVKVGPRGV